MKHKLFFGLIFVQIAMILLMVIDQATTAKSLQPEVQMNCELVQCFKITDLALWSEAQYTRHPSQTDTFSPFKDFPGAPEHFPSGSIIAPAGIVFSGLGE